MNFPMSFVLFGFVLFFIYEIYRVLDWIWFTPKKLEKRLREQGFKGNPYRLIFGDQYESAKMIKEAMRKPIGIEDDVRRRTIPHVLNTIDTYGKDSFMWVGRIPRVTITDPDLIREVLTKNSRFHTNHGDMNPLTKFLFSGIGSMNGEPWAKRRKIIKSAFHFDKLKLMLPAFYESCHEMVSMWCKKVPEKGSAEVDVWSDIKFLTGDVISRTVFGSNFEGGRRIFELIEELHPLTFEIIRSVYIPGQWLLPTKINRRMKAIDKEIRERAMEIINKKLEEMKEGKGKDNDLLSIMLKNNQDEINKEGIDYGLTLNDIIGESRLFYFAGQDTTSTLILWTMILLSRFPEWQTRARNEVLQVFGDSKPTYEGISQLKVVSMILHEVLRLYSPVPDITRVAIEDTQIGKFNIPAGVQIMLPQPVLHLEPEIWGDDATEFKPERFAEGVIKAAKNQGAFFPFGFGPKMCLGQNFAYLEAKMAFSVILPRFSFELSPSYIHAPYALITMQPQHGAHLILHKL